MPCPTCRSFVWRTTIVAGKQLVEAGCVSWFRAFPYGCLSYMREPGSDDEPIDPKQYDYGSKK